VDFKDGFYVVQRECLGEKKCGGKELSETGLAITFPRGVSRLLALADREAIDIGLADASARGKYIAVLVLFPAGRDHTMAANWPWQSFTWSTLRTVLEFRLFGVRLNINLF